MASDKLKNFLAGTSLADVAAPAGSIIATGINAISQARQNKLNREWTEKQNDLAWLRERQLIDEQRAYDTPKAQMQRLMAAGLNPNLIYGGVDQSPMQAQSAPNASGKYAGVAPQIDPYAAAKTALLMAQVRRIDNQNDNDDKLTENEVANGLSQRGVNDANIDSLRTSATLMTAETEKTVIGSMLLSEQRRSTALDNTFKMTTMRDAIDKFSSECKIAKVQANSIAELLGAQIFGIKAKARADFASAHLSSAMVGQVRAVADLYRQQLNIDALDFAFKTGVSPRGQIVDDARRQLMLASISSNYQTSIDQSRLFKKQADLLDKFGDSNEVLQLILLGSQTVRNFSESISTFLPSKSFSTSTSSSTVRHIYDD